MPSVSNDWPVMRSPSMQLSPLAARAPHRNSGGPSRERRGIRGDESAQEVEGAGEIPLVEHFEGGMGIAGGDGEQSGRDAGADERCAIAAEAGIDGALDGDIVCLGD